MPTECTSGRITSLAHRTTTRPCSRFPRWICTRHNSYVYQVGNLIYAAQTSSVSSRAVVRWEVLNATTNAVVAQGDITDSNLHFHHGSIAANDRGDVVIGFAGNSSTQSPSIYY